MIVKQTNKHIKNMITNKPKQTIATTNMAYTQTKNTHSIYTYNTQKLTQHDKNQNNTTQQT